MAPLRRLKRFALPAAFTVGLLGACDIFGAEQCQRVVCQNSGFVVTVFRVGGQKLPEGQYDVKVVSDGKTFTQECHVGFETNQYCYLTEHNAKQEVRPLEIRFEYVPSTGRIDVRAQKRPTDEPGGTITGPEKILVDIRYEGQSVIKETYTPDYLHEEPTGEGCGYCDSGWVVTEAKDVVPPADDV